MRSGLPRNVCGALLALALACLFATPAAAAYREKCWLKYWLYKDAWSPTLSAVCTYATGKELNERAGAQEFAGHRVYVIVNWPVSGRGYIRIAEPLPCGFVAEAPCAERISHLLHGRDEFARYRHGRRIQRRWLICQPGIMGECAAFPREYVPFSDR